MYSSKIETIVGAVVLAIAIAFGLFIHLSNNTTAQTTKIFAKFSDINGLKIGSKVLLSGVPIGEVSKCTLDEDFNAIVEMLLDSSVKLPVDTTAAVAGLGLFSAKYVTIEPGIDDDRLKAGDEISVTSSSVSIENLIGKMLFSNSK